MQEVDRASTSRDWSLRQCVSPTPVQCSHPGAGLNHKCRCVLHRTSQTGPSRSVLSVQESIAGPRPADKHQMCCATCMCARRIRLITLGNMFPFYFFPLDHPIRMKQRYRPNRVLFNKIDETFKTLPNDAEVQSGVVQESGDIGVCCQSSLSKHRAYGHVWCTRIRLQNGNNRFVSKILYSSRCRQSKDECDQLLCCRCRAKTFLRAEPVASCRQRVSTDSRSNCLSVTCPCLNGAGAYDNGVDSFNKSRSCPIVLGKDSVQRIPLHANRLVTHFCSPARNEFIFDHIGRSDYERCSHFSEKISSKLEEVREEIGNKLYDQAIVISAEPSGDPLNAIDRVLACAVNKKTDDQDSCGCFDHSAGMGKDDRQTRPLFSCRLNERAGRRETETQQVRSLVQQLSAIESSIPVYCEPWDSKRHKDIALKGMDKQSGHICSMDSQVGSSLGDRRCISGSVSGWKKRCDTPQAQSSLSELGNAIGSSVCGQGSSFRSEGGRGMMPAVDPSAASSYDSPWDCICSGIGSILEGSASRITATGPNARERANEGISQYDRAWDEGAIGPKACSHSIDALARKLSVLRHQCLSSLQSEGPVSKMLEKGSTSRCTVETIAGLPASRTRKATGKRDADVDNASREGSFDELISSLADSSWPLSDLMQGSNDRRRRSASRQELIEVEDKDSTKGSGNCAVKVDNCNHRRSTVPPCWWHGDISRSLAERILNSTDRRPGNFLVRISRSGGHSLSMINGSRDVIHIMISDHCEKDENKCSSSSPRQYVLGMGSKPFKSISSIINHYTKHPVPIRGSDSHVCLRYPVPKRTVDSIDSKDCSF